MNAMRTDVLNMEQHHLKEVSKFELTFKYYNTKWEASQNQLQSLIKLEFPNDNPKAVDKRIAAFRETSILYLKYIRICNELIDCYAHIAQPQKRRYLKKLSEACICRVLELKHELVNLDKSDFQFLDQVLLDLQMLPSDGDITVPEYVTDALSDNDIKNKMIVEKYLTSSKTENIKHEDDHEKRNSKSSYKTDIVKSNERSQHVQVNFNDVQNQNCFDDSENHKIIQSSNKTETGYANIIQRACRRFLFRKRFNDQYFKELRFLNILPYQKSPISPLFENHRKEVIKRNEDEYVAAKMKLTDEMYVYKAPKFSDEIEDTIRSYIHEYKKVHKKFPKFPSEDEGGSTFMLSIPLVPKVEPEEEDETKKAEKSKAFRDKKSKNIKKSKDEKSDENEPTGFILKPSKFVSVIVKYLEEYEKTWRKRESVNLDKYDEELLHNEVSTEIKEAVRQVVDKKMRQEVSRLEKAMEKDKKKKKGKKKDKKGGKKKGKDKQKHETDLSSDGNLDSFISELVNNGIITNYPKVYLKDFLGDYNYYGSTMYILKQFKKEPMPCFGDIKRVIREYCILPMGSEKIHLGEDYVKSILFAGPKGSGKNMLIYSICTEIGATLIDLSAENLEGKYPGQKDLEMLMDLVSKVSRLVQPTIIFIKDAENYFWEDIPSTSKLTETTRLNKHLPKLLKRIGHLDRILVCGTTAAPFDVDQKLLRGCYEKIICVFEPDYDCRCQVWREMITKYSGKPPTNSVVNVLSNVSDGFTAGAIKNTVKKVLTGSRLAIQDEFPITAMDFHKVLAEHIPVYEKEHKAYVEWMRKMPLSRERKAMLEKEMEENPPEEDEEQDEG